jgi:probable phosphoglycerate mutase
MKPRLFLCRHGNTFNDGDKVVMVGAGQDLPLTEKGRSQAREIGEALKSSGVAISSVRTAPLKRTLETARVISAILDPSMQPIIDTRLTELDYGEWGGLSDQEIALRWGASVLADWHTRSIRPQGIEFSPSQEQLESEVALLLNEISQQDSSALVVTSNGRLRTIGKLISHDVSQSWKVGTGKMCVLEWHDDAWAIVAWDCAPATLSTVLSKSTV